MDHPVIALKNLPADYASTSTYIVAIQDNTRTVRISWSDATSGFVRLAQAAPASSASGSENGGVFYTNDSGVFSYNATARHAWGKSPRYTTNWDDLDGSVRFLLVNKVMQLSQRELQNARETLDIAEARSGHLGLVMPGNPVGPSDTEPEKYDEWVAGVNVTDDGAMIVPYATPTTPGAVLLGNDANSPAHAAVTRAYLDGVVAGIKPVGVQVPVATTNTLGGILVNPRQFSVDATGYMHIYEAKYPTDQWDAEDFADDAGGTVKLGYSTVQTAEFWQYAIPTWDEDTQTYEYQDVYAQIDVMVDPHRVPTVMRVRDEIVKASKNYYNYVATYTYPGLVAPKTDGAIILEGGPGRINVRPASGNQYGAVYIADTVEETDRIIDAVYEGYSSVYRAVPTLTAIREYTDKITTDRIQEAVDEGLFVNKVPIAGNANDLPGLVRAGTNDVIGVRMEESYQSQTPSQHIERRGTLYCRSATSRQRGVVYVQTNYKDNSYSAGTGTEFTYVVPNVQTMQQYVEERVTRGINVDDLDITSLKAQTIEATYAMHAPRKPIYAPEDVVPYRDIQAMITGEREAETYIMTVEDEEYRAIPSIGFSYGEIEVRWGLIEPIDFKVLLANCFETPRSTGMNIIIENRTPANLEIKNAPSLFPAVLRPGAVVGLHACVTNVAPYKLMLGPVMLPMNFDE